MQNKLISDKYFKENIHNIENIKDKELLNSILVLVSFHSGNTLLSDKNISKFDSVSIYSTSMFSQSLIKDIADSYNLLEKSILNVNKSIYKDLLLQNPTINGKEFYIGEDTLVQKDLLEDLKKVFDEKVEEDGTINNNDFTSYRELWGKGIHFPDINIFFNHFKSLGSDDSNKQKFLISFKKDGKKYEFLNRTGLAFKNKRYYIDEKPLSFDISPRYNFIQQAYLDLTQLKIEDFSKVVTILRDFLYGYISRDDNKKISSRSEVRNEFYNNSSREIYDQTLIDLNLFEKQISYILNQSENSNDLFNNINNIVENQLINKTSGKTAFPKVLKFILNKTKEDLSNIDKKDFAKFLIQEINNTFKKIEMLSSLPSFYLISDDFKRISQADYENVYEMTLKEVLFTTFDINEIDDLENNINTSQEAKNILDSKVRDIIRDFKDMMKYTPEIEEFGEFSQLMRLVEYTISIHNNIKNQEYGLDLQKTNLSMNDEIKIMKSFISRQRASVFDIKVDSYVLNLRDGKFELNEQAQKLYNSSAVFKKAIDNLRENKYYDYFEFDRDFIDGKNKGENKEENLLQLLEFSEAIKNTKLPVSKSNCFKVRKLGNYGGTDVRVGGIYFHNCNTIVVDTRDNSFFSSVRHEEIHRADLNNLNKIGRGYLVDILSEYFDNKLSNLNDKFKSYLMIPEELIARAGEIAYLLKLGNFEKHYASFLTKELSKDEMLQKMKEDFENSSDSILMKPFDTYLKSNEYIDFDKIVDIDSIENKLIPLIQEYYKSFFGEEKTDIEKFTKLIESTEKMGFENRLYEGIKLTKNISISDDLGRDSLSIVANTTKDTEKPYIIALNEIEEKQKGRDLNEALDNFIAGTETLEDLKYFAELKLFDMYPLEDMDIQKLNILLENKDFVNLLTFHNQINLKNIAKKIDALIDMVNISYKTIINTISPLCDKNSSYYVESLNTYSLYKVINNKFMALMNKDSLTNDDREFLKYFLDSKIYLNFLEETDIFNNLNNIKLDIEEKKEFFINITNNVNNLGDYISEDFREKFYNFLVTNFNNIKDFSEIFKYKIYGLGFKNFLLNYFNNSESYDSIEYNGLIKKSEDFYNLANMCNAYIPQYNQLELALMLLKKFPTYLPKIKPFGGTKIEFFEKEINSFIDNYKDKRLNNSEDIFKLIQSNLSFENISAVDFLKKLKEQTKIKTLIPIQYILENMIYDNTVNDFNKFKAYLDVCNEIVKFNISNRLLNFGIRNINNIKTNEETEVKNIDELNILNTDTKSSLFSNILKDKMRVYFDLKNGTKQKIELPSSHIAGVVLAYEDNQNSLVDKSLLDGVTLALIEDFKKITYNESDIIRKINLYIKHHYIDNSNMYIKYQDNSNIGSINMGLYAKDLVRDLSLFSKKIQDDIVPILKSIKGNSKKINNIFHYVFDYEYEKKVFSRRISFLPYGEENIKVVSSSILEEIKNRVNLILNQADYLTEDIKTQIAENTKKVMSNTLLVKENTLNYKDINLKVNDLLKQVGDKNLILKLNLLALKISLFDNILIKQKTFNENFPSQLYDLSDKLKFHLIKTEKLHNSKEEYLSKEHLKILEDGCSAFLDKYIANKHFDIFSTNSHLFLNTTAEFLKTLDKLSSIVEEIKEKDLSIKKLISDDFQNDNKRAI